MSDTTDALHRSWERIARMRDDVARSFYQRLFDLDAAAAHLFAGVDMVRQRERLMQSLEAIVRGFEDPETITHMGAQLGRRHVGYGVADRDYDVVQHALVWALDETPGLDLTPEERAAWNEAIALIVAVMRRASTMTTAELRAASRTAQER